MLSLRLPDGSDKNMGQERDNGSQAIVTSARNCYPCRGECKELLLAPNVR